MTPCFVLTCPLLTSFGTLMLGMDARMAALRKVVDWVKLVRRGSESKLSKTCEPVTEQLHQLCSQVSVSSLLCLHFFTPSTACRHVLRSLKTHGMAVTDLVEDRAGITDGINALAQLPHFVGQGKGSVTLKTKIPVFWAVWVTFIRETSNAVEKSRHEHFWCWESNPRTSRSKAGSKST